MRRRKLTVAAIGLCFVAGVTLGIGMDADFAAVTAAGNTAAEPTGFTDLGIGAKVAECRGIVATHTSDGRNLVIANALDTGATGYVVVTDVDSGTSRQIYCPEDVPQGAAYASILASTGKFYTGQGRVLVELDPALGEWTFHGVPSRDASAYLALTEGPDGVIWAGAVYQTVLISFDPRTREMTDHGRLDPAESYVMDLAVDEMGWVYAGIGTARGNIVAYNPETGEKRQLVPEGDRVHETAVVYPTVDGAAFGAAAGVSYRLYDGTATVIDPADAAQRKDVGDIYWGQRSATFPDGRRVRAYDLPGRTFRLEDPVGGDVRTVAIEYEPAGVVVTSLGRGPAGVVYGSTAHPMHLLAVDTAGNTMADHGPIPAVGGGNFCAIASQGDVVIGAQYSHGRLWTYRPAEPWNPTGANPSLQITDTLTVEAWVDPDEHPHYGVIATRGSNTYFFALTGANTVALLIGDNSGWNAIARGSTRVTEGWTHVAGTYDSSTGEAKVFVNGVEDGAATGAPLPIGDKGAPLSIGSASSYADTYHFHGELDELRVHARLLTPDELGAHARLAYADDDAHPDARAIWRFDESPPESVARDASRNGNDGAMRNMDPSTSRVPGVIGGALSFDGVDDFVSVEAAANPRWVAEWPADICRPRTALGHPDGHTILMGGFAGYGLCGGGIGIYDLASGEETLLTADDDLLSGHSPITVDALSNGDLVAGTSIAAPGGGHVTETEAALFTVSWQTKRVTSSIVPVPGDTSITSVLAGPYDLVYGLSSNATFFVFDPATQRVVHAESFAAYGGVPRHALHQAPDGRIVALLSNAILAIAPATFEHAVVAEPPVRITAGGALSNGLLSFASGAHVWTYRLGPAASIHLPFASQHAHARASRSVASPGAAASAAR